MKYSITAHHIDIEEKLAKSIESKVNKLSKLVPENNFLHELHIAVTKDTKHHNKGEIYKVEISQDTKGKLHHSGAVGKDIKTAFDKAYSQFEQELSTHYKKKGTLFKKGAQTIKSLLKRQV
jgi:ribosomal subunit interface protein